MEPSQRSPATTDRWQSRLASALILAVGLAAWAAATSAARFDASAHTAEQLTLLEFNGDIVRDATGAYVYNPEKPRGFPGPLEVGRKLVEEWSNPFHRNGTNDHGIGHLIVYTLSRFALGFSAASLLAVTLGVLLGLSPGLYRALNPFIQVLKPISPLAWMPLLLYTVQDPRWTAVLVVFMAALWPTLANTAFGVSSIRKEYIHVSRMLELSWARSVFSIAVPAAAPAIIAGLRISFGSALVAVVPAEMLLGELGVGYLTWIEWNNLDIAGVLFAILVVGCLGTLLDLTLMRLSTAVSYAE
jgi:nitrate/nitrite transport system permease protein